MLTFIIVVPYDNGCPRNRCHLLKVGKISAEVLGRAKLFIKQSLMQGKSTQIAVLRRARPIMWNEFKLHLFDRDKVMSVQMRCLTARIE